MPKQEFLMFDFLGPLVAAAIFGTCLLVISFFLLNFCFVLKSDELTVFERFGSKHNVRLGPHTLSSIRRHRERKYLGNNEETSIVKAEEERVQSPVLIPQVKVDAASTS